MGTNGGSNNTLAPNVFNLEINCSNLAINLNVFAFFYVLECLFFNNKIFLKYCPF